MNFVNVITQYKYSRPERDSDVILTNRKFDTTRIHS